MISALLRDDSYRLAHAYSGQEALDKAAELKPDLVLLDVMMPDIDGFEVCRRLRAMPDVAEAPIIMVTALVDRMARLQGLAAGADDFVSKPFDQAELRVRIRTITRLDRHRRLLAERRRYERLVELAPDGVLIVDAAGLVRMVNPALERLVGQPGDALLGQPFLDLVAPAERAAWVAFFSDASRAGESSDAIESSLARVDGSQVAVEITAGAAEWDGAGALQVLVRDISRRRADQEALRRRNQVLRMLAARLADAQENERQALARELHDQVGQSLTAINLNMTIIEQLLDKGPLAEVRTRLTDSQQLLEEVTRQVRTVMAELRPPLLDEYGLLPTLRWYGERFSARTGIRCLVEGSGSGDDLPHPVEMALFRICQEALNNVAKHANATAVAVRLHMDDCQARLTVEDNGQGFEAEDREEAARKAHWGLLSMHERALAVNGELVVASIPGQGAQITVTVNREDLS